MRRLEIDHRLKILSATLPFIEEFYMLADIHRKKTIEEIKALEEERAAIIQGQLLL